MGHHTEDSVASLPKYDRVKEKNLTDNPPCHTGNKDAHQGRINTERLIRANRCVEMKKTSTRKLSSEFKQN